MKNYINSLLADISYIQNIDSSKPLAFDLANSKTNNRYISEKELLFFNRYFKVIEQKNELNGFSAIAFELKENLGEYKAGNIFISYRGTEPTKITDLATDVTIAVGITDPIRILEGVYNYTLGNLFGDIAISQVSSSLAFTKKIHEAYPDQLLNLSGHSLGGFLAMAPTLANPEWVNETITYNAVGVSYFGDILTNSAQALFKGGYSKISYYFSDTGLSATSHPGLTHFGKRFGLSTEYISWDDNHSVRYLRELLAVYDSLAVIMGQSTNVSDKTYTKIDAILDKARYPDIESNYYNIENSNPAKIQLNFKKTITYIAYVLGYASNLDYSNGFNYNSSVLLDLYDNYNKYSLLSSTDNISFNNDHSFNDRSKLFSIMNYIPFIIQSNEELSRFTESKYDPLMYNKLYLEKRLDFYKKAMIAANKDFTQASVKLSDKSDSFKTFTFFQTQGNENLAYIDSKNKIILLQNISQEEFFTNDKLKRIYFIDEKLSEAVAVTGDNSIVFDSFNDDAINIYGKNVDVYLTRGKDTVTIEVGEGASLGIVDSTDEGKDDKFIFQGSDRAETINATKYSDIVNAGGGDDIITTGEGSDVVYGGSGNDNIDGGTEADVLYGGVGSDYIVGGAGDDIIYGNTFTEQTGDLSDANFVNQLFGGLGRDTIIGGEGKDIINNVDINGNSYISNYGDIITGGKGDDIIYGTRHGDTFNYTLGDGNDTYIERNNYSGEGFIDIIKLNNIAFSEVSFSTEGTANLYMTLPDGAKLTFTDFMQYRYVEMFQFSKGDTYQTVSFSDILPLVLDRTMPTDTNILLGNDNIGITHVETLRGRNGMKNVIQGGYGKDIIYGGDQNDILGNDNKQSSSYISKRADDSIGYYGDSFTGGKGDDQIYGTAFGDTYYYNKGDGNDTITEQSSFNDQSGYYIDQIILGVGITQNNLTISRDNNNNVILNFKFPDNTTGSIIMKDFILGYGVEKVVFSDNTTLSSAQILDKALTYYGTENGDYIAGTNRNDIIYGNGGADWIEGNDGDDKIYLKGNKGDKGTLVDGGAGKDYIEGSDGDDILWGGYDSDVIIGGAGDDYINHPDKNSPSYKGSATVAPNYNAPFGDNVTGGLGNDIIYGTAFADTYNYTAGDGHDFIYDQAGSSYKYNINDTLILNKILPGDVSVVRSEYSAILTFSMGGSITLADFFSGNYTEVISFTTMGASWSYYDIYNKADWKGTDGNDVMEGSDFNDTIHAGAGNDTITGGYGTNYLYGEDGNDTIYIKDKNKIDGQVYNFTYVYGGAGNDIIGDSTMVNNFYVNALSDVTGGTGDDVIYGSTNYNIYRFNIGDGKDVVYDTVNYTGQQDKIVFGVGISLSNLIFSRENKSDLVIQYSTNDQVTIKNYFFNPAFGGDEIRMIYGVTVKLIEFADGSSINLDNYTQLTNQYKGTDSDDTITILSGFEIVKAGKGNDNILSNGTRYSGGEYYGEDGNDVLSISGSKTLISGGKDNDNIYVSGDSNTLLFDKGDGIDSVFNSGSNTIVQINTSVSDFYISSYNSTYIGFTYGNNSTVVLSGNKDLTFKFTDGTFNISNLGNRIMLGNGDDMLANYSFTQLTAYLGGGNDTAQGTNNNDWIFGEAGHDTLYGNGGDDVLDGGAGNDNLYGGAGFNTLRGGLGDDTLHSTTSNYDYLQGGAGNDTYFWYSKNAEISDSEGANTIWLKGGQWTKSDYHFSRIDSNLVITREVPGTNQKISEQLTVNDFFNNQSISQIKIGNETDNVMTSSTYTLDNAAINRLIEAMAAFDASSDTDTQAQLSDEMNRLWHYS